MNLDATTVVIRPRSPSEAVDLGYRLARAWWRPIYAVWFTMVAPVWALAYAVGYRKPWIAAIVLWWLRPLFDRAVLHVVSHAVFGDFPGWRRNTVEVARLWRRQLFSALVLHRFDPARSFHQPVRQLEGRAAARQARFRALNSEGLMQAMALTATTWLLELCLFLAALGLAGLLSPAHGMDDTIGAGFQALIGQRPGAVPLLAAASLTAYASTAPGWVAAGFALYLSSRTRLEGWDVELAFRRLARRLLRSAASLLLLVCVAAPALAQTVDQGAAEAAGRETTGRETAGWEAARDETAAGAAAAPAAGDEAPARRAVREVLAEETFGSRRRVLRWRPRAWWADAGPRRAPNVDLGFAGLVASVVRFAIVGFAAAAVVWILIAIVRSRRPLPKLPRQARVDLGPAVLGAVAQPEELPADVPAAALAAWRAGHPAAALGLLYRGALARLAETGGRPIEASWTEEECRRELTAELAPPVADYFGRLTDGWTAAAFAQRPPAGAAIEGLCAEWPRHFRSAA